MLDSSVQFSHSVVSNTLRPHELQHVRLPCPSPTPGACSNSCPLSRLITSNHLMLCHPLLLLSSIFPSNRVFPSESVLCIKWPKYWSFSFNISPSNEYSGLQIASGQTRDGKSEHQHSRNQWTKMDWNGWLTQITIILTTIGTSKAFLPLEEME